MSRKTLELLNSNFMVNAKGAINRGVVCHFNSLIQSLLSCTSITNYLLSYENKYINSGGKCEEKKEAFMKFIEVLKMQIDTDTKFLDTRSLLSTLTKCSQSFGSGQEDINEGFLLLLDAMDDELSGYFRHVYKVSTYCSTCENIVCAKNHKHQLCISIPPLQMIEKALPNGRTVKYLSNGHTSEMIGNVNNIEGKDPLNRYIKQTKVSTDRKCPKCSNQTCVDIYQLDQLSDILVLLFKKYTMKNCMNFPPIMTFKARKNGRDEIRYYKMVAQMEHTGGRMGGHYYATCLRKEGYVTINDTHISPNPDPEPTPYTYMVFYHIFDPSE